MHYTYNGFSSLVQVDLPDGTCVRYAYDACGRRVARDIGGTRTFGLLYDWQDRIVAQLDPIGAVTAIFIYAGLCQGAPAAMIRDGRTYRIVVDHLGGVRLVVDAETGQIVQRLDYDAWGRVITDTRPGFQPFGFAGGLYDPASGLTRFGIRDYRADLGRWLTREPGAPTDTTTNAYRYADADPINKCDRDGNLSRAGPLKRERARMGLSPAATICRR